jgi:signal transduction histidine kinase
MTNEPVEINDKKMLLSSIYTDEGMKMTIILNDITEIEKLKAENELNERRSMLGELSFKIAHELKNPLNGISLILQRISRKEAVSDEEREMIEDGKNEVERMNRKIVDFMKYSKPIEYDFKRENLLEMSKSALDGLKALCEDKKIVIENNIDSGHFVMCDREYMAIAFKNILLNAIEASFKNGRIILSAHNESGRIRFTVEDFGRGIEKENLDRIFDLYFTTKENGSGVGLANAYKIIKDNHADIILKSEFEKGTIAAITFKGA